MSHERAALLVAPDLGPDYPSLGGAASLNLLSQHLTHVGYNPVVMLSAAAKKEEQLPTKHRILETAKQMASRMQRGDVLLVYVMAYGQRVPYGQQMLTAILPCNYNHLDGSNLLPVHEFKGQLNPAQCSVAMVLDLFSDIPLWDEEQMKHAVPETGGMAVLSAAPKSEDSHPMQSEFFTSFVSALEDLRERTGKVRLCEVYQAMSEEMAKQSSNLVPLLFTDEDKSGKVILANAKFNIDYVYNLICSVPVATTLNADHQKKGLETLKTAIKCVKADGFMVMLDLIIRVRPQVAAQITELTSGAQAFCQSCRRLGTDVPQLKRVQIHTIDHGTITPSSTAVVEPLEVADVTFVLATGKLNQIRDKVLLNPKVGLAAMFAGFDILDVRSTFQAVVKGSLKSYISAQAYVTTAEAIRDVRLEKIWIRGAPILPPQHQQYPPAHSFDAETLGSPLEDSGSIRKCLTPDRHSPADSRRTSLNLGSSNFEEGARGSFAERQFREREDLTVQQRLADGTALYSAKGHWYWVSCVDFSHDDQWLGTGGWDCAVRVYHSSDGALYRTFEDAHSAWVTCLCFGKQRRTKSLMRQRLMNAVRSGSTIDVPDLSAPNDCRGSAGSDAEFPEAGSGKQMESVLASGGADGVVLVWKIEDGRPLYRLEGHAKSVCDVAFSRNHVILASCGEDRTIRCWSMSSGTCVHTLEGHKGTVTCVTFGWLNYTLMASCSFDHQICIWNVSCAGEDEAPASEGSSQRPSLALPTKPGPRKSSALQNILPPQLLDQLNQQLSSRKSSAASAVDSQMKADPTAAADPLNQKAPPELRVPGTKDMPPSDWSTLVDEKCDSPKTSDSPESPLKDSPDKPDRYEGAFSWVEGEASDPQRNSLPRKDSVPPNTLLHQLEGHKSCVLCLAISRNDEVLASAAQEGPIFVWSIADRTVLFTLKAHTGVVTSLSFGISLGLLASGGRDGKLIIWNAALNPLEDRLDGKVTSRKPEKILNYSTSGKAIFQCKFGYTRNLLAAAGQDCATTVFFWKQGGRPPLGTGPRGLVHDSSPRLRQGPVGGPIPAVWVGEGPEEESDEEWHADWESGWDWPHGLEQYGPSPEAEQEEEPGPEPEPLPPRRRSSGAASAGSWASQKGSRRGSGSRRNSQEDGAQVRVPSQEELLEGPLGDGTNLSNALQAAGTSSF